MRTEPDEVAAAIDHIEARAEGVRAAELDRALDRLDEDELSEAQRAAVEALSERLVEQLVSIPRERLRRLRRAEAAATALELFSQETGR